MKTKYIVYIILAILLGSLVYYRYSKNQEGQKTPGGAPGGAGGPGKGGQPTRVNGIVVTAEDFSHALSVSGSIEANEQVQVRSEIPGLVTAISFEEGSNVNKGQVLLKINDRELQAQLSQALTKQKLAEEHEYRAGILYKKEAISKEEYDVALADLRSLQAQTQLIQAQLSKTQIKAPFSGKIGLRSVSAGEYLTPNTVVANLVSVNPVKLSFSIPEKYSGQIKLNTEFSFTVSGSTKKYTGRVYAIEPSIDLATRTLQLKARAENPSGELLPGSFAKIDLPLTNIKDAILVPTEAIIPVLKGKKVFISKEGKAQEIMVETGTRTEKAVLITSGLSVGDTVLTTGMMSLKPDMPVKIKVVNK
ncbi:MAG TPA: efflux RND transporter periplasmic adaptor subunit [Daejeonella sp.]|nr:efflux RND transporter periplasmic adaptor subunit [Daejeonella sp.]